jgi:hypothetical protein
MSRFRSTVDRRRAEQRGGNGAERIYSPEELAAALWRGGDNIPACERYTLPTAHGPLRVSTGTDHANILYTTADAVPFGRRG